MIFVVGCSILPPRFPDSRHVTTQQGMEQRLQSLVEPGEPPGLSLAVVKADKLVYQRSFGYADGHASLPASSDTIHHWWSITKPLTAVAILQLQEQGRLNVNDTAKSYLPLLAIHPHHEGDTEPTIKALHSFYRCGDIDQAVEGLCR